MKNSTEYSKGNPEGGLTPITSSWMHQLFKNPTLISELFDKYSSPINIHHLPTFSNTISSFKKIFDDYGLKYQIFYARKANKSKSLVKQAFASGIGVDTASFKELEQSIGLGGNGKNLVLTAAIKTKEQYELAIENDVAIVLDNKDECQQADSIAKSLNKKAIIGIRVSGFIVEDRKLYSRFGFDIERVEQFISENFGTGRHYENLTPKGLHFHLDGYSTLQRGKALSDSISLIKKLNAKGFKLSFIDIGGGILMNYLENEEEWTDFELNLKKAVEENDNQLIFNGNGLGYEMIDKKLIGSLKTYPYFNKVNGTAFLKEVLNYSNLETGKTNAHTLKELQLELRLEPGRSLLDQVGMTVAKVAHRKQDAKGQWLVGLEMNMTQMMSSSADFLLDPFVIYRDKKESSTPVDIFFTGAYCLERDVLLKRKINVPHLPQIGDFVAFVNTAGYMMHFFETEAHLFELSKNLSFSVTEGTSFLDFVSDDFVQ